MQTMTYTAFRNNLKASVRKARNDAETILVSNRDPDDDFVVVSARDWESIEETQRIMENPPLHRKILTALAEARAGQGFEHPLVEA